MHQLKKILIVVACLFLTSCFGKSENARTANDTLIPQLVAVWEYMRLQYIRELQLVGLGWFPEEYLIFGKNLDAKLNKVRTELRAKFRKENKGKIPEEEYREELNARVIKLIKSDAPSFYVDATNVIDSIKKVCKKLDDEKQYEKCVLSKLVSDERTLALSRKHNFSHDLIYRKPR